MSKKISLTPTEIQEAMLKATVYAKIQSSLRMAEEGIYQAIELSRSGYLSGNDQEDLNNMMKSIQILANGKGCTQAHNSVIDKYIQEGRLTDEG